MKISESMLEPCKIAKFPVSNGASYSDRNAPEVQAFKKKLLDVLEESREETTICAWLEGVRLSASCIHETIGAVLEKVLEERLLKKRRASKYILGVDTDGLNEWDADAALEKASRDLGHKVVCVWKKGSGKVNLVGDVDEQVRSTYNFVLECQEGATTRKLADHYGISIQAASNRMRKAANIGLVRKFSGEAVSGGGRQNVYKPIS